MKMLSGSFLSFEQHFYYCLPQQTLLLDSRRTLDL